MLTHILCTGRGANTLYRRAFLFYQEWYNENEGVETQARKFKYEMRYTCSTVRVICFSQTQLTELSTEGTQ